MAEPARSAGLETTRCPVGAVSKADPDDDDHFPNGDAPLKAACEIGS